MSISLTSFGAAGTVTGSKHMIELSRNGGSMRLLLDCGMFQGEALREIKGDPNRSFGFDPKSIDVLVLSHAHIDHSGLLPRLVAEGFNGVIWSTPATRDLCEIMLMDSAHIQEYDYEWEQKKARQKKREVIHDGPLYSKDDVAPTLALFRTVPYGEHVTIAEGVDLHFTDTGHILGSAAVQLVLEDGDRKLKLAFSGDVGRYVDRILPDPVPFPQADVILCESTYGDRDHSSIEEAEEVLLGHVLDVCVKNKGRMIIPAFSVGRTQEVLYTLNKLSNEGRLPRIPVFVDSPLAISATGIARSHTDLFRENVQKELHDDPDLFSFPGTSFVRSADGSRALNDHKEPCIIVSASGMMEAGRVRHHLRLALPDPKNMVLAVGFCAPGTLGDRLIHGAKEVSIFGEKVPVNAKVVRMDFYSAHGDRSELKRYLSCQDPAKVKKLFLVHGVDHALEGFREQCLEQGFKNVIIPERGERFEL